MNEYNKEKVFEVMMVRDHLDGIPGAPLPQGYSIRRYRDGDYRSWIRIHLEAEPYHRVDHQLFSVEFGTDEQLIGLRQFFVCDPEEREVGTATAWFNDDLAGHNYGRIHWVAVSPQHQGMGLAKALTATVCRRFVELGHPRALVTTESFRLNAIGIYRKFGFVPSPRNRQEQDFWENLNRALAG